MSSKLTRCAAFTAVLATVVALVVMNRPWAPPGAERRRNLPDFSEFGPPLRDAIESAVSRVRKDPETGEAWGHLGMLCQAHDLLPEARDAYRTAAELEPGDARWPALLGLVCEILSLTDQSIQAYTTALEKNPEDLAVLCSLAQIKLEGGDDEAARPLFVRALAIDDRCVAARVGLGQIAARSSEDEAAIEHLDVALQEFPYCGAAHAELTRIYRRTGDAKRAEFHKRWSRVGRKIPIHNPLMAEVSKLGVTYTGRMNQAKTAMSHGKWAEALEHFEAAASLRNDLAEPRASMAIPLTRLGRLDEAIDSLKRATTLKGRAQRIEAWLRLAPLFAAKRRWSEAFAAIDSVLDVEPHHARALLEKGRLHRRRGERDHALAAFEQGIRLHPEDAEAHLEKGKLLLEEAVPTGTVSGPDDREDTRVRLQTALSFFEKALELQADLAPAYEFAAEARMHLWLYSDDRDEKAALLGEALELYADHVFYFPQKKGGYEKLARALITAGNRTAAREVVQEALKRWPRDPRFRRFFRR